MNKVSMYQFIIFHSKTDIELSKRFFTEDQAAAMAEKDRSIVKKAEWTKIEIYL